MIKSRISLLCEMRLFVLAFFYPVLSTSGETAILIFVHSYKGKTFPFQPYSFHKGKCVHSDHRFFSKNR